MDLYEKYQLTRIVNACGKMTHLAGAAVLPALVTWGPYPVAMIGVPGVRVENSAPPSVALLALAQLDPIVGDVVGNAQILREARTRAAEMDADLIVASELVISGYPPEDLVLKPRVTEACQAALSELEAELGQNDPAVLIGAPIRLDHKARNSVFLLQHGKERQRWDKFELPDYGVRMPLIGSTA